MQPLWMAVAALSIASLLPLGTIWVFQSDTQIFPLPGIFGCLCCYLYNSRRSLFVRSLAADLHLGWQLVDDNRLPQRP
jgi:hypothetical protein